MANSKQLNLVAIPTPFYGHIAPMLELCFSLASTLPDSIISLINVPLYHARIADSQRRRLGLYPNLRLCSLPETHVFPASILNGRDPEGDLREKLDYIDTIMASDSETLIRSMEVPASCIIGDVRLPFGKSLSETFGIPWFALWTQSAACYTYHDMASKDGFALPTDESTIIDYVPGVPPHTIVDVPSVFRLSSYMFDYMTKPFKDIAQGGISAVLMNTFQSLEPEALSALCKSDATKFLSVGPLLPPGSERCSSGGLKQEEAGVGIRDECLIWLDAQPPASVLYISFGSLFSLDERSLVEVIHGIEASGQRFLWSYRSVSSGSSLDMENFKTKTEGRGMVVDWTPQLQVLSHPAIGGFLSHCGWNSCMESLCSGVPLLGFPQASDQALNLRCIVDAWKVGLALNRGEKLHRDDIGNKIHMLICGPEGEQLRKSARKIKEAASLSTNETGSSSLNLKLLVNIIKQNGAC